MNPIPANDAAGGAGSIQSNLLGIAINGISRAADGYLSRKFPLTSFNEAQTVSVDGKLVQRSAPQKDASAASAAVGILQQPAVIAIGVSVAITIALVIALRK